MSEEEKGMHSAWKTAEGNHLECSWTDVGQEVRYDPSWMQSAPPASGTHLTPLPDFASHSPFGRVAWFRCDNSD